MSDIVTDRSIKRAIVVRPETTNIVTFGFSASIAALTWHLYVRKFGAEYNAIELNEDSGLTKTTTQLVANFDPVTIPSGEYFWSLYYSGVRTYYLTNGTFKVVKGTYQEEAGEAETVTVNLNGVNVTLTISPWAI